MHLRNGRRSALALGVLVGVLAVSALVIAGPGTATQRFMPYQGLLEENGAPVGVGGGVSRQMSFRLCNAAVGGSCSAVIGPFTVEVTDGRFSLNIGPYDPAVLDNARVFLEVTVAGVAFADRQEVLAVPFANRGEAGKSFGLTDPVVTGDLRFGVGGLLSTSQGASLELGRDTAPAAIPFIDFHNGSGAVTDFNVRLINDATNQLTLQGNSNITGNLAVNGTSSFVGTASFNNIGMSSGSTLTTGSQTINGVGKEIFFSDANSGQIRLHDDAHRIMLRRGPPDAIEIREFGDIILSTGVGGSGVETDSLVVRQDGHTETKCRPGFTAIADGHLCMGPMRTKDAMFVGGGSNGAMKNCRANSARVCTHADIQQACGAGFDPYAGRDASVGFWMGDPLGDDVFLLGNFFTCGETNITAGGASATNVHSYRCCY